MFVEFNLLDYYLGVLNQDNTVMQVLDTITLAFAEEDITASEMYAMKKAAYTRIMHILFDHSDCNTEDFCQQKDYVWFDELISMKLDTSVFDDINGGTDFPFEGPVMLTDDGKRFFDPLFNLKVELLYIDGELNGCTLLLKDMKEGLSKDDFNRIVRLIPTFFEAVQGMCSHQEYVRWFKQ